MPDIVTGLIAGGASLLGSSMQANAVDDASAAQSASTAESIAEQRRQFDAMRALLAPYTNAGTGALQAQQNLIGLGGSPAQQSAISALEASPQFGALMTQGENAMRQNASATGGLRGGNFQAALAQFRPQLLNSLIEQQYSSLGGITSLGQNAAAGVGNYGMQTGANVANLLGQQGAATAGGIIGQANAWGSAINAIPQGLGMYYGMTGRSPFGGASQTMAPIVDHSF